MNRSIHPSVAELIKKYPSSSGELNQIYHDLHLAQRWQNVIAVDLEHARRPALIGVRAENEEMNTSPASVVVPCSLSETLSLETLQNIFISIDALASNSGGDSELSSESALSGRYHNTYIYLAITSPDSSQVYYRISSGIVKPQM